FLARGRQMIRGAQGVVMSEQGFMPFRSDAVAPATNGTSQHRARTVVPPVGHYVTVPGTSRYHRPSCPLVAGKDSDGAARSVHVPRPVPWPVAAGITLLVFGVAVAWALERLTRSLGDVPEAVVVVATVGLLLGIQGLLWLQYGTSLRPFPDFLPTSGFHISGVTVTYAKVISVVIATVSAFGLYGF